MVVQPCACAYVCTFDVCACAFQHRAAQQARWQGQIGGPMQPHPPPLGSCTWIAPPGFRADASWASSPSVCSRRPAVKKPLTTASYVEAGRETAENNHPSGCEVRTNTRKEGDEGCGQCCIKGGGWRRQLSSTTEVAAKIDLEGRMKQTTRMDSNRK